MGKEYCVLGNVLVTNRFGPVFAIETATKHSLSLVKDRIEKWFMLESMASVLLVHLKESCSYSLPIFQPQDDKVFLINF